MKINYNGGNESIINHINAWKDDFAIFEKCDTEEIEVIDNNPKDLDVTYKFNAYDNTAEVQLKYISACAAWFLTITLQCYSQRVATDLPLMNDEQVLSTVFTLLEQMYY